ncbi:MAG: amidohydrolase, partial [Mycobacterium sp.]
MSGRRVPNVATLFDNGTIWTGAQTSDALLVADGVVVALGQQARDAHADEIVDLQGGFLMPSFGDGHAHPL